MKITVQKVVKGFRYLKHYGLKEFFVRLQEKMEAENIPYESWYERHRASVEQLEKQRKAAAKWQDAPTISIVVPLYRTPEKFLREMIASVKAQSYPYWQLCLSVSDGDQTADGNGEESSLKQIVRRISEKEERIVYCFLEKNLGIAGNTNAAIALATGQWIAFLDHDDLLAPDALFEAASLMRRGAKKEAVLTASGLHAPVIPGKDSVEKLSYDMIYTDEDKVDMEGRVHFQPHLKPDINIDLLRSNNYITHFLLVRREIVKSVGGIRPDYDGAQDYDFILRCVETASAVGHVPRILYHWRTHQDSTSENPFSKQYAVDAGKRAISDHLNRLGIRAEVTPRKDMGFYSVTYEVCEEPLVSIIIPNKDEAETLKKCLASIGKSSYRNFEIIIVENNSEPETFQYYKKIAPNEQQEGGQEVFRGTLAGGQKITIPVWKKEFNYSALNNFGVSFAEGTYFVFLNNDIEIINADWLEEMLGTCQRKEVGIVGAKLYYPDDTVQHAGIVVGIGGSARGIGDNMFTGLPKARSGYLHKASLQMDYSAVTAACMMVKREAFEQVNGFEEKLAVAFNDVDFCLKIRAKGLLVVFNPLVQAYHYESKSRGSEDSPEKVARFQREIEYMRTHWISILKQGDPYYNPNFSSVYNNYSLKDNS